MVCSRSASSYGLNMGIPSFATIFTLFGVIIESIATFMILPSSVSSLIGFTQSASAREIVAV